MERCRRELHVWRTATHRISGSIWGDRFALRHEHDSLPGDCKAKDEQEVHVWLARSSRFCKVGFGGLTTVPSRERGDRHLIWIKDVHGSEATLALKRGPRTHENPASGGRRKARRLRLQGFEEGGHSVDQLSTDVTRSLMRSNAEIDLAIVDRMVPGSTGYRWSGRYGARGSRFPSDAHGARRRRRPVEGSPPEPTTIFANRSISRNCLPGSRRSPAVVIKPSSPMC